MKKVYTILLLLIFAGTMFGQNDSANLKKNRMIILKYAPFSLFGDYMMPTRGVQIGAEVMIGKRWSLQQDVDYIFKNPNKDTAYKEGVYTFLLKKFIGFRTDIELKKYFKEKPKQMQGYYT